MNQAALPECRAALVSEAHQQLFADAGILLARCVFSTDEIIQIRRLLFDKVLQEAPGSSLMILPKLDLPLVVWDILGDPRLVRLVRSITDWPQMSWHTMTGTVLANLKRATFSA